MAGITRRDFLDGVALAIGAGLTPACIAGEAPDAPEGGYPPALTGLRGQHDRSFEVAEEYDCELDSAQQHGRARYQRGIANSDSGWSAYAHVAIDEARRAVAELPAG